MPLVSVSSYCNFRYVIGVSAEVCVRERKREKDREREGERERQTKGRRRSSA